MSYNINGLKKQISIFYKFLINYDVIAIFETHVTENFSHLYENYFTDYIYVFVPAMKINVKGRASGGCIFAYKKWLTDFIKFQASGGITYFEIVDKEGGKFSIVPYYINCTNWESDLNKLIEAMEELDTDTNNVMIIGDLNARIGLMEAVIQCGNNKRKSNDVEVNANEKN